jgi:hypothetical protein
MPYSQLKSLFAWTARKNKNIQKTTTNFGEASHTARLDAELSMFILRMFLVYNMESIREIIFKLSDIIKDTIFKLPVVKIETIIKDPLKYEKNLASNTIVINFGNNASQARHLRRKLATIFHPNKRVGGKYGNTPMVTISKQFEIFERR